MSSMAKKFTSQDRTYWSRVVIASSQVTFGVFWAALFVPPLDTIKVLVILFNGLATVFVWFIGWTLVKRGRS